MNNAKICISTAWKIKRRRGKVENMGRQGNYYIAKHLTSGEMGERCETLEEMREAIDQTNEHHKTFGYQQHQYIICLVQWGNIYDEDDLFVSSHKTETRIEIYPETMPLNFPTK